MHAKTLAAGLLALALAAAPLGADGVSFLVLETGLPGGGGPSRHSVMWEDGLFEAFFEAGRVTSNAPSARIPGAPGAGLPPEADACYRDAIAGGMGYFLVAIIDHPSLDVSLRLFSTRTGEAIAETTRVGGSARSAREELESVRGAAGEMAALLRRLGEAR